MKTALTCVLIGVLATGSALVAQSRSAADLYQEALHLEEVKGDLQKAIATYQLIVERFATDRSVAAKALLGLGRSYERLGRPEAAQAYQKVIRDFADQKELVAQAQSRLAGLPGRSGAPGDTAIRERQRVWAGDDVNLEGLPSKDGRYLAFIDYRTTGRGNVALRDLRTGQNRLLTHAKVSADGFAEYPIISPDNSFVAYGWYTNDEYSIRLIRPDGSGMRVLATPLVASSDGLTWSSDGKQIAAVLINKDRTRQIALVKITDGSLTQLVSTRSRSPWLGGFSPDGRWLVYSLTGPINTAPDDRNSDIFAIAADGSRTVTLVDWAARDTQPAWTPDGRAVVFVSNRSGADGLWSIRVEDGKPVGLPVSVRPNIGPITNMGFTRNGTFFYGVSGTESDLFLASIDPDTLNVTSPPRRLSTNFVGSNSTPAWSPDGRFIAFLRGPHRHAKSIVIRSVADGVERNLPTKLLDAVFTMEYGLMWFPDSRSVLVRDDDAAAEGKVVFRRVDIETGKETVVFEAGYRDFWPPLALSPDGRAVYYTAIAPDTTVNRNLLRLMSRDLATGHETELFRRDSGFFSFYGLSVSPDGSRLVFLDNVGTRPRTLVTVPIAGGTPTELYAADASTPRPASTVGALTRDWTRDGRYLVTKTTDGAVWAFPAGIDAPRKLDWPLPVVGDLSPDGRQTVFTVTKDTRELRTIENLLPLIRTAK